MYKGKILMLRNSLDSLQFLRLKIFGIYTSSRFFFERTKRFHFFVIISGFLCREMIEMVTNYKNRIKDTYSWEFHSFLVQIKPECLSKWDTVGFIVRNKVKKLIAKIFLYRPLPNFDLRARGAGSKVADFFMTEWSIVSTFLSARVCQVRTFAILPSTFSPFCFLKHYTVN